MIFVNNKGELVQKSFMGKDIRIKGVLFNEKIFAAKCHHYALYGGITADDIINHTLHFSTI